MSININKKDASPCINPVHKLETNPLRTEGLQSISTTALSTKAE
uniref:Uncharacterized protein n=1 Tax=Rhizophora mucronata TaxID=61149 RepID=A0A2P2P7P6_RHIMU